MSPPSSTANVSSFDAIIRRHRQQSSERPRKPLMARRGGRRGVLHGRISSRVPRLRPDRMTITPRPQRHLFSRRFDAHIYGQDAVEDPETHLRRLKSDHRSLIVALDGSCIANGFPEARGSYGVFFSATAPASALNRSGALPIVMPQTSDSAIIYAATQALEAVQEIIVAGNDFSHVVLKTNNENLVRGLSERIWTWSENGYLNNKGEPVMNGRAIKYLHEKLTLLEKEYGMTITFCLVDSKFNAQADALSKEALRELPELDTLRHQASLSDRVN